jgi:hypothetical protein
VTKFTFTHEIDCEPETFWKVFFDKSFNEQLFTKALEFPAYAMVEQREDDRQIYRKVAATPKLNVPGPVAKVLGANMSFVEEGTFDKTAKRWHWTMTPSAMADKIRNEGTVRVEPAGEGRCRRITDVTFEAKVFGIGGMIESSAEKNMREAWDTSAAYMTQWVKDGKAK